MGDHKGNFLHETQSRTVLQTEPKYFLNHPVSHERPENQNRRNDSFKSSRFRPLHAERIIHRSMTEPQAGTAP